MKKIIRLLLTAAVAICTGHNAHGMLRKLNPTTKRYTKLEFTTNPEAVENTIRTLEEALKPERIKNADGPWFAKTLYNVVSLSWLTRTKNNRVAEEFRHYWAQFFNLFYPNAAQINNAQAEVTINYYINTTNIFNRDALWFASTAPLLITLAQDNNDIELESFYDYFKEIYQPDTSIIQTGGLTLEDTIEIKIDNSGKNIKNKLDYDNNKAYIFALLIELLRLGTNKSFEYYDNWAQKFFDVFISQSEPTFIGAKTKIPAKPQGTTTAVPSAKELNLEQIFFDITMAETNIEKLQTKIIDRRYQGASNEEIGELRTILVELKADKAKLDEQLKIVAPWLAKKMNLKHHLSTYHIEPSTTIRQAIIKQLNEDIAGGAVDIDNVSDQLIDVYQDIYNKVIGGSSTF